VASERAALEEVESQIVLAQRDIRLLQTEIGTRARLSQLERWNIRVLSLSAPTADQILGDKFQLARLIAPERKPALEAPVILASAPAAADQPAATVEQAAGGGAPAGELLHEASVKIALREQAAPTKPVAAPPPVTPQSKAAPASTDAGANKAGDKPARTASPAPAKPVRTARADPLAPLPADQPAAKEMRTDR